MLIPAMEIEPDGECVVLIHGFLGSPLEMIPLSWALRNMGYHTLVWGHFTVNRTIAGHSEEFLKWLKMNEPQRFKRVHLVGHSMGAVIARSSLERASEMAALGRMVLLTPPNKGSHVADLVPRWIKKTCPVIDDLSTDPESFVNGLSSPKIPTGVVWTPTDHMVRPDSVKIEGLQDELKCGGLHTTVLYDPKVWRSIARFLETGKFGCMPSGVENAAELKKTP